MAKMTAFIPSTPSTIDRLPDVKARTGLSRSTIYKLESEGKFPQRIKLGERAVGWRSNDVDTWIATRVSAGEQEAIQ